MAPISAPDNGHGGCLLQTPVFLQPLCWDQTWTSYLPPFQAVGDVLLATGTGAFCTYGGYGPSAFACAIQSAAQTRETCLGTDLGQQTVFSAVAGPGHASVFELALSPVRQDLAPC